MNIVPEKNKVACLDEHLTFTIMKCLERLVIAHINSSLSDSLDPMQFTHRRNKFTVHTISVPSTHLRNIRITRTPMPNSMY